MEIRENVPLAPLTTLEVGGPARYFAEAHSEDDVREAVRFAQARQLPFFVLGGGSNLVVADGGWPGLVLKIAIDSASFGKAGQRMRFDAGAGVNWDELVAEAVSQNCAGIECLSGIPGTVGGTPVQNVGAYGQEVSQTIESVRAFDLKTGEIVDLASPECGFSYRSSIFNSTARGRYIILRARFLLSPGGAPSLKYADVQRYFSDRDSAPTLAQVRDAVREIRHRKGMLIVPGDADSRSVGSFFKNPVLSEGKFEDLNRRAESRALNIPNYPALNAQHKVSAAWLVEHSGFEKGYRIGEAGISHKHALALINAGHATAGDIMRLKENIQQRVDRAWGILLEPEPVFVGF
jgi:UDP-N-acetylmuramate dehydrogenase